MSPLGGRNPARILVVDDNPAALYGTARVLRAAGYEVMEAETGTAALASAGEADLVVLDVNLPDFDGFEVCRRMRAHSATVDTPVLHLSASFTDVQDLAIGLQAGGDSYLTRPVEPPVLLAAVRTLLFARRADQVRRSADAKLRTLFDVAPVAMATFDADFRYESANPAFCQLTGYGTAEFVARRWLDNLHGESLATWEQGHARLARGEDWRGPLSFLRRDGVRIELDCRFSREPLSRANILVATDITEQRQLELQRERLLTSERAARAAAERSNRIKDEFLAILSHELRNPISAILGWSMVISRTPDLPEVARKGIQAIERNSKLQAQMIADLLDYAGISYGKMRLDPALIDPYPAIRAAFDVVRASAGERGVTVDAHFTAEELFVEADAARLQQIVWNLLSNAIKFTPSAGRVQLRVDRDDARLRLVVEDTGQGIAPEFLPHIFERFTQQDSSTTRGQGGLGLGLALVRQLVDLQGGAIEASSDGIGHGARFTVWLPLRERPAAPRPRDEPASLARLDGVTALVVEDDEDTRELIKRVLLEAGARVVEAHSAAAALQLVAGAGASVLVSDIGMPLQNGYDLLRALRARGYGAEELPALALTAFARNDDRSEALAAGFQDHLVKPFEPQSLVNHIVALRAGADHHAGEQRSQSRASDVGLPS